MSSVSSVPAQTVPPFQGNISFNAQHAPMGAFFSFTCGHFGTRGGFGLQIGKPGNQDLYIGVKDGDRFSDAPLKMLPFYDGAGGADEASRYDVERTAGPAEQNARPKVVPYAKHQLRRHYGWATDRWVTDDCEFTIYTPCGSIHDPQGNAHDLRADLLPAIVATLVIDNRHGRTRKTGCFAINFPDRGTRILDAGLNWQWPAAMNPKPDEVLRAGFAFRNEIGVAGDVVLDAFNECSDNGQLFTFMRWSPTDGLQSTTPMHHLGTCPGIGFEVPPGEKRTLRLALGCYLGGVVTTRLEGRYLYTRYYSDLLDVLNTALTSFGGGAEEHGLDAKLLASGLSPDQQFLIAHATRSYYGSTQLLDVAGQPLWVVNEGEYCMMNTLDLAVDQAFWELEHNPWVVRNLLDNFVRYYSYHDGVKAPGLSGGTATGGISFCHDMGVHNNFSPFGQSSYELPDLAGCFSYMTIEQLCNWSLLAACYVARTRDVAWAERNDHVLSACYDSLMNRCDGGYPDRDSTRCGSGQEITTYDSLDESLGQARANLYLSVKAWAAVQGLRLIDQLRGAATDYAGRGEDDYMAKAILEFAGKDGVIPAVFEEGNRGHDSRVLAACEALVYPLYLASCTLPDDRPMRRHVSPLYDALKRHTLALLTDPQRRNLFADGGIKLSSTSNNSWMSKIALFQHVARRVFQLDEDPAIARLFASADAAHVRWQTTGPSAYWACSDQFLSGVAKGSRYYPRVITAALWLTGSRPAPAPEGSAVAAAR